MSKPGALDLANSVGGTIAKEEVNNAVEKYEKYHCYYGGDEKERKANYADMPKGSLMITLIGPKRRGGSRTGAAKIRIHGQSE
ncbi:hypothetical protein RHSIM_Rhsim05G0184200 [Rhododendron simsii]|uniref:Uncharacterized protein n=1 Tax=Rhododendron simsii TaxID=118357 RepID=A0A834LMH4_RHOSS|nr:hypothetical protein RHSIM_Rhsim05G0184200 [Rhododendron simsii]